MSMRYAVQLLGLSRRLKRLLPGASRKRVPEIRQLAMTDCGAAALAMVLGYHGKHVSLDDARTRLGIGRGGASAESIMQAARSYGMSGRAVRAEIEHLASLPAGTILHWEFRHFVVFERLRDGGVEIVDPARGRRTVPMESFRKAFTGVALLLEPTESFEPAERTNRQTKRIFGLFRLIFERKGLVARIISVSMLVQLLSLAMPLLTGVLIDRVVPRRDYSLLMIVTVGYCVIHVCTAAAGFLRAHLMIHLRTRLEVRFTMRFLNHLVDLPYSFFQQHSSGDLMVRLGSNNNVREILTSTVLSTLMDGTMASGYLILLILASGPVTLAVVILAAARIGLMALMRWRQKQLLAQTIENQSRAQTQTIEMLAGMETLKAMGLEHQAAENWSNVFVEGINLSIKRGRLDAMFNVLLGSIGALSTLVMMFYGTYLVLNGSWTLGTMMTFNAIAGGFLGPLNNLVSSALQLQMLEVYLDRLNEVMDTPSEQDPSAVVHAGPLSGGVALEHVSFGYSPQDPVVIRNVSIEIPPGTRVALVGRTGCGKSTMARLLAGLYSPISGRVLFDGKDLTTLDRRSVRNQLGIVTQDTQLFGGSIRRNISIGLPELGLDRVIGAAKLACIHDEISAMALGYETPLSDRGLSLSGGQRQRIAIARALAGNPKILILDEATSHLDTETEERVARNIASLGCTTVVIAHRLSTIRDANMILVLDGGQILEQGTYQELIDGGGLFSRLAGGQSGVGKLHQNA